RQTAPAAGSTPATGAAVDPAAPDPRVKLATSLPELTEDDVLAVPVGARGALPSWLAAADLDPEWVTGALADTGNGGRP
ncbi:hypothetical protein NL486_27555, partial [Klebsiella pneumoniae]|nr:hypothetical protein [Klebsiella pneumoniae]